MRTESDNSKLQNKIPDQREVNFIKFDSFQRLWR